MQRLSKALTCANTDEPKQKKRDASAAALRPRCERSEAETGANSALTTRLKPVTSLLKPLTPLEPLDPPLISPPQLDPKSIGFGRERGRKSAP